MHRERPNPRRRAPAFARSVLLIAAVGSSWSTWACGSSDQETGHRTILASRWDTVFRTGVSGVDDGLFGFPTRLALWDDLVVFSDRFDHRLVAIDMTGEVVWSVGGHGGGPGQFEGLDDIDVYRQDTLWVLDQRLGRISQFLKSGAFVGAISVAELPRIPGQVVTFEDGWAYTRPVGAGAVAFVSAPEPNRPLDVTFESEQHPWSDTLTGWMLSGLAPARRPSANRTWVGAFRYGPGFMIFEDTVGSKHPYVVPGRFSWKSPAILPTKEMRDRATSDSVEYAAASIDATDDRIFMLAGGRPQRVQHDEEPTRFIDIYDWDGVYRGSYHLPFHTQEFATDGDLFVVTRLEPYPAVIGLRPVLKGGGR